MKTLLVTILFCCAISSMSAEEEIVPADPSILKLRAKAKTSVIVALCHPNKDRNALQINSILKGQKIYNENKNVVTKRLPSSDAKALKSEGFKEIAFFEKSNDPIGLRFTGSYAIWPEKVKTLGDQKIRFLALDLAELRKAISDDENMAEQNAAEQPATAPQSKSK